MQTDLTLGIDIGGTNIAFGLVNQEGEIVFEGNLSTAEVRNPSLLPELIEEQTQNYTFREIGIGAPSSNTFSGMIENAPNLRWGVNIPIVEYFENYFKVPTKLTNDANAAAVGEKLFGAAKDFSEFVVITLGTGLGAGIFINNEIFNGKFGTAGEFGHVMVDKDGRPCGCGRKGCLETYCSATGMLRSIDLLTSPHKANSPLVELENPNPLDIFNAAQQGDQFAEYIIDFTAEKLGYWLANFACFSNPEAFILFGGIAKNGEYFRQKVDHYTQANLLNLYQGKVQVLSSELHHRNAAILGAAAYAKY
ncbi:glucokinase [Lishizhenia tianjinensis]|uniref:Glucokinase n=1 Tax=Lishizhenia tianjinensis TaxID=477690 RepID=A0A1I6XZ04_9FLAO|nr:ROK family protein [Lishizhenia tianjinensis]SFT43191.1 glucokinase [Lishizhenia tianjinensis]